MWLLAIFLYIYDNVTLRSYMLWLDMTDFGIVRCGWTRYGWEVAAASAGVRIGVVEIGTPGTCVYVHVCVVW